MTRKQQIKHLKSLYRYCSKAGFYPSMEAISIAINDAVKELNEDTPFQPEAKAYSPFKGELPECQICKNRDCNKYGVYCMIPGSLQTCKESGMCINFYPERIN